MTLSKKVKLSETSEDERINASTYSRRYFTEKVPKHEFPADGMPADAAYQLVHDEINLDGNPSLNLASFVTTWMEPKANKLINENLHKNDVDHDEYPQTTKIQERVVNILARLYHAPEQKTAVGTNTIGSSEAIMLGLLAHKWTWKQRRQAEGKPFDRPNLVMGADVHVVWEKFARYFDVEPRIVPMDPDRFIVTAEEIAKLVDENTICVGAVVGTTYTGQADPVAKINDMLVDIKTKHGWNIPIHVDGASGGFILPFTQPDLAWDFRLEQVRSINVSGHKYGLVYPGLGWLIFRDQADLPKDLVFDVNYLGGDMPTYTLNFSKGSAMVLAQYYNVLRFGKSGYARVMANIMDNARHLAKLLTDSNQFELLNAAQVLPIVTVRLKDTTDFTVFDLSEKLREQGWIVPAYTMPPNAQDIAVLRVVAKENFSREMANMLFNDIKSACNALKPGKVIQMPKPKTDHQHLHMAC